MAIYQYNEPRTISCLQSWNACNPANAPFVKIGKLLLAVDQTGAEAWQPLIMELKQKYGATKFMIYSGRHGALEGCFQDNGNVPLGAAAPEFYNDDVKEASRFATVAGVDIEVVDTGRLPKALYKRRVIADVSSGFWVIVSWCHSIASMCEVPDNVALVYHKGSVLWVSAMNMVRRGVKDVINEDYPWSERMKVYGDVEVDGVCLDASELKHKKIFNIVADVYLWVPRS